MISKYHLHTIFFYSDFLQVFDTQEGITYCLEHGYEAIEKKKSQLDKCKLMFTYNEDELEIGRAHV